MTRSIALHELAISNTIANLSRAISGIAAGRVNPSAKPALENELVIVKRQLVEHLAQLAAPTPTPPQKTNEEKLMELKNRIKNREVLVIFWTAQVKRVPGNLIFKEKLQTFTRELEELREQIQQETFSDDGNVTIQTPIEQPQQKPFSLKQAAIIGGIILLLI